MDDAALGDAVDEYLLDASAGLGSWLPEPEGPGRLPLTVILHDVRSANYWTEGARTCWLEWPLGPSRRPVRVAFAPLLHTVLVLDRRRELGIQAAAWTQAEVDTADRGLTLPVELRTVVPGVYEP